MHNNLCVDESLLEAHMNNYNQIHSILCYLFYLLNTDRRPLSLSQEVPELFLGGVERRICSEPADFVYERRQGHTSSVSDI